MTGNQQAWIDLACETSTCWYEYFPGFLYYTEPECRHFELGALADNWLHRWATARSINANTMKHLDRVVLKVMENDMYQVIHDCQQINDSKWFVTHLTDLLFHCGQLHVVGDQQTE